MFGPKLVVASRLRGLVLMTGPARNGAWLAANLLFTSVLKGQRWKQTLNIGPLAMAVHCVR